MKWRVLSSIEAASERGEPFSQSSWHDASWGASSKEELHKVGKHCHQSDSDWKRGSDLERDQSSLAVDGIDIYLDCLRRDSMN